MKIATLFVLLLLSLFSQAQSKTERAVRKVFDVETETWNRGDLDAFMKTYASDGSILIISHASVLMGWNNAHDNYKKAFPTKESMGVLRYDLLVVKKLSPKYYYVVGKFFVDRDKNSFGGHFDLLFKKIHGKWLIVSDHTS